MALGSLLNFAALEVLYSDRRFEHWCKRQVWNHT